MRKVPPWMRTMLGGAVIDRRVGCMVSSTERAPMGRAAPISCAFVDEAIGESPERRGVEPRLRGGPSRCHDSVTPSTRCGLSPSIAWRRGAGMAHHGGRHERACNPTPAPTGNESRPPTSDRVELSRLGSARLRPSRQPCCCRKRSRSDARSGSEP
jgi:hypothetical protein